MFLGAGCPLSVRTEQDKPLIPDIAGLTQTVYERFENSSDMKQLRHNFANDEKAEPNVQDLLSHIRGLRAIAGKEAVRVLKGNDLDALD